MKIKKLITRETVLKALKTEPLRHGAFWHNQETNEKLKTCDVCAVGAVLRHTSFESAYIKYSQKSARRDGFASITWMGYKLCGGSPQGNWEQELSRSNYLGALSSYFEDLGSKSFGFSRTAATKSARLKCVQFVKKHFPESFEASIVL